MTKKITEKEFLKRVHKNRPYLEILSKFKGSQEWVKTKCKNCGQIKRHRARNIMKKGKCHKCTVLKNDKKHNLSQKQFEQKVHKHHPEFKILTRYIDMKHHIKVKCTICGKIWMPIASNLAKGTGCPGCAQNRMYTQKEFIAKAKKASPTIKVIGKYKGHNRHVKAICLLCGYIWHPYAQSLLRGQKCPKCATNAPLTQKEFEKQVYAKNPNVLILGKYKSKRNHIKTKCLKCGHIWSPRGADLIQGKGCPKCAHKIALTQKTFEKQLHTINPNVKIIGKFTKTRNHVKTKCLICGYIWSPEAESLLEGYGCPKCGNRLKFTQKEFEKRVSQLHPTIKIIGKYINSKTRIKVQCKICGFIWYPEAIKLSSPSNKNKNCPKCTYRQSKGELETEKYLKKHRIKYKWQFVIPECKYKQPLPFDFAVFNQDGTLNSLIEYQGFQHYLHLGDNKNHAWLANNKLIAYQHMRDWIKKQYCKKHHIRLIYICHPYTWPHSNKQLFIKKIVTATLDTCLKPQIK